MAHHIFHMDLLRHAISVDAVHDGEPVVEHSPDLHGQTGRKGQDAQDGLRKDNLADFLYLIYKRT